MKNMTPTGMTVIEISDFGSPDVLRTRRSAVPVPAAGEVLIKVIAAGVNRPDLMQRRGLYPPPPGASEIPGLEIAGEVVAVAKDVARPTVGEQVCALVSGGGYAQYCTASAPLCLPIPRGLDFIQAAALPETFFTVWANVFERGHLQSGESLLVHGGTSGIGITAIQLARECGATVIATAGSKEKCRVCEALGAAAINYRQRDFAESVKLQTEGRGVDLILDIIGADYFERNLSCLAVDGRLVLIALQSGVRSSINLLPIMLKRLTITGSTLRPRSAMEKAAIAEALRAKVWPLLEAGRVRPIIHAVFPLEDARFAHQLMESGEHIGKIVLAVA